MAAIDTTNPSTLFAATTTDAPATGIVNSGVSNPIPTNQWWGNAIMKFDSDTLFCFPYVFRLHKTVTPEGMEFGIPSPTNTTGKNVFGNYATLGTATMAESYATTPYQLMSFDDMGAKFRFFSDATHYFESYIYRGMTTISVFFNNVTPVLDSGGGVAYTNFSPAFSGGSVTTNSLSFKTNQAGTPTWVIQTPGNVTWNSISSTKIQMSAAYTGWVFFTYITNTTFQSTYTNNVGAVVTGVSTSANVVGSTVQVAYNYTVSSQILGKASPLIALLTHHNNRITDPTLAVANASWTCLRGPMYGYAGTSFTFSMPLLPTPSLYTTIPTGSQLTTIANQLAIDKSITITATDPYGLGKELGKLGTLAGIADLIGDPTTAATIRAHLKTGLLAALDTAGAFQLQWDSTWNGVMTKTDDFGNRDYNDHHFHWGYWLYGAAMLAKADATWFSTNNYQVKLNALARDYANPDTTADTYFPKFRSMDMYEFHSWAHGILTEGDGKDQESDSESLNSYYGLALWGQYSINPVAQQAGQALFTMELEGTKSYYHMTSDTAVVNLKAGPYTRRIPGILFLGKFDYATFFDAKFAAISGIHFFPAASPGAQASYASDLAWVAEECMSVGDYIWMSTDNSGGTSTLTSPLTDFWYQVFRMMQAMYISDVIWTEAASYTGIDDGMTLTNIFTWIVQFPRARPPARLAPSLITRTSFPTRTLLTHHLY